MKRKQIIVYVVLFAILVVGGLYATGSLNILGDSEKHTYTDMSCNNDGDCYSGFLERGVSQTDLDEALIGVELYCTKDNVCEVSK